MSDIKQICKTRFDANDEMFDAKAEDIFDSVLRGDKYHIRLLSGAIDFDYSFDCSIDWLEHTDFAAESHALCMNKLIELMIDFPVTPAVWAKLISVQAEVEALRYVACKGLAKTIAPYIVFRELMQDLEDRELARGEVL